MRFDVISLFPEMVQQTARIGVTGKAFERGITDLALWNPRDYTDDKHNTVDDKSYGGGPGMVMKVEPLSRAILAAKSAVPTDSKVIYLSPQGKTLDQARICELSKRKRMILLCGRYEGVDQRLLDSLVDEQYSLGDYVISGGELAALIIIDAVTRLLPGVLGDEQSASQDSFMHGLLDYPHYTRPEVINGMQVPAVLQSGNHELIRRWRCKQALGATWKLRPDLLNTMELEPEQAQLLEEFKHDEQN